MQPRCVTHFIEAHQRSAHARQVNAGTRCLETVMAIRATPEVRPPQLRLFPPWTQRVLAGLLVAGIMLAAIVATALVVSNTR
jgi:hypothetical protein